jgi:hypothetical protein
VFEENELISVQELSIILATLMEHDDNRVAALACKLRMRIITSGKSETKNQSLELFREAIKELSDELLPIRAHGMSILRQLVLVRDDVAIEHLESIITIFLDLVQDQDSFIFLNAIKGCSALAESFPVETIDRMMIRYKQKEFGLDNRLRIGESILQIIQRSGEAFTKLAERICPAILVVLRDEDARLQSSALILSSVIANQTPRVIVPFIYQILDYILSTFELQKELAPRRGALVLISNLIRSLGFEFGAIVERKWLVRLREIIKRMAEGDKDLVSRGHAQSIYKDLLLFI